MIPYFILLLIVALLSQTIPKTATHKMFSLPIILIIFTLVAFAAIRKVGVGTDSGNYVGIFKSLEYSLSTGFKATGSLEIGFLFFNYLILKITNDYWILFLTFSLLSVIPYIFVFRKISIDEKLSIFIYIASAIYLFTFNGARQGIAASLVAVALYFALHRKILFFILFVFAASLFHKTAIIMLPFYYLINIKFSYISLLFIISVLSVSLILLGDLLVLFDQEYIERYSDYVERNATGGQLITLFFLLNNFVFIYFRNFISSENISNYEKLLFLANIHTIIYLVVVLTGKDINIARFSVYFSLAFPLIWPIIFSDVKIFRLSITRASVILAFMFFYYIYLDKMSDLTPYKLNPLISLW